MVRHLLITAALLWGIFSISAATDTSTRIFSQRFKTLKTTVEDNFMSPPVIRMGTNDRIIITFDEIAEDNSYLEYRLIHCNSDWQPSRLVESEYISGFNSIKIEDYAFSSSTFVHYVNYMITLPNDDMRILHSGNYLLQVYDPDSPDETLVQTRFQVSENAIQTDGSVTSRTDKGFNSEWQQLSVYLDCEGSEVLNPYQDLLVEVTQNMNTGTTRFLRSPLRVEGSRVVYEHMPDLIFPASNEYRRFESVSNSFPGMHVDSLRYMGTNYHVWLKPDYPRAEAQYSYDRTQHGRFLVHEYNATDSDTGADYITVHFMLESPEFTDADVYVDGEFIHNTYDDHNRMVYDRSRGIYTAEIPVKQGAYNYQYVVKPRNRNGTPVSAPIEGNKYETENEYGIAVWLRTPGARADRLVSFTTLTSARF